MKKKLTDKEVQEEIVRSVVGVRLTIRCWSGASNARDVAREMEDQQDAEHGTLGAKLFHLPEETSKKIGAAYGALRDTFNSRSLPFRDGGLRIVPAESFLPLMEALRGPIEDYERVCKVEVIDKRDELAVLCQKRQGKMFRGFPSSETLALKYRAEFNSESITVPSDCRIEGMSEAAMTLVRQSMEKQIAEQVSDAVKDIGSRLMSLVADMEQRLSKPNQKGIRYGGLMEMAGEVCACLRGLNITKDPDVDAVIEKTFSTLTAFKPESLRSTGWARTAQSKAVIELTKTLNNVFGKAG